MNCQTGDSNGSRFVASNAYPEGAVFAMVDTSVQFVSEEIANRPPGDQSPRPGFLYQNLFVKDDGESIGAF